MGVGFLRCSVWKCDKKAFWMLGILSVLLIRERAESGFSIVVERSECVRRCWPRHGSLFFV